MNAPTAKPTSDSAPARNPCAQPNRASRRTTPRMIQSTGLTGRRFGRAYAFVLLDRPSPMTIVSPLSPARRAPSRRGRKRRAVALLALAAAAFAGGALVGAAVEGPERGIATR